jgi:hypothetical protein
MTSGSNRQVDGTPRSAPASWVSGRFRYVQVAVAGVLVLVIVYWVDVRVIARTLAATNPLYAALAIGFAVLDRYLVAYKWAVLLRSGQVTLTNWEAFRIYMASGFVGTVLPTGLAGDVFRAIRTTANGPAQDVVAASIVVERLLGFLGGIILAIVGLLGLEVLVPDKIQEFRHLYYGMWAGFILILAVLALTICLPTGRALRRLLAPVVHYPLVGFILDSHRAFVEFNRSLRTVSLFVVLSVLQQAIQAMMGFLAAKAMGLTVPLLYFFALGAAQNLVLMVPVSIAAVGTHEASYIILFSLAGLSPDQSLSIALFMRLMGLIMLVPAGLCFLYDSGRVKGMTEPLRMMGGISERPGAGYVPD